MKLLLDTHVFLWWREASARLGPVAVDRISHAETVYVSSVSAWEVAIKQALGKLRLRASFAEGVDASGFTRLPVDFGHAAAAGALPPLHEDPFDRMLVAQAQIEGLAIVTADAAFKAYDVEVIGT